MKNLLKNPKILIWLFFIVISIILIAPNPNPQGMVVTFVGKNATLGIAANDVIYKINDAVATKEALEKNYSGMIKLETNKGTKFSSANGSLGLTAEPVQNTNLKFGLDIKGGVRAVIEPNTTNTEEIDQIISTLQTRINIYGLREAVFRPVYYQDKGYIEISMAGGSMEELKNLLESQGKFEGKIPLIVKIKDGKGTFKFDKNYEITIENNDSIIIEGKKAKTGETIIIADVHLLVEGINSKTINFTSIVFSGNDIKTVFFDPQRSRVERLDNGYQWSFSVQLSKEGAQKFAWVTANSNSVNIPGRECYLDVPISLYLDSKVLDTLSIACSLKGKIETEISISGGAASTEEAKLEKARLQSILRSGALPTSIQIVQLDKLSPNLGSGFLKNTALAGAAAIVLVLIVVGTRYRKPKIILPMVVISFSEVLIILGMSVVINWTIDLAAIAGIIAAVGTGIDSQIVIIDQTLRGEAKLESMKEKLKRAFFVIFGSAGTVIAAMLPLMILGFGLLRGFAITTIMGVLIGVFIARPAYGEIVKKIVKE